MSSSNLNHLPDAEPFFQPPLGTARNTQSPGACLFAARRFTLDITALRRDTTWVAGRALPRVRLYGLAKLCSDPITVHGPESDQYTELRATWVSIQAADPAHNRMEYSILAVSAHGPAGEQAVHSELQLFVEPEKFAGLLQSLESPASGADRLLRVDFMLEAEDAIALPSEDPSVRLPVFDLVFNLQQAALTCRSKTTLLPQLDHLIAHCVPASIQGHNQLEAIASELARSLGNTVIGQTGQSGETAARLELNSWLNLIRHVFHGEDHLLFALPSKEFESKISQSQPAEKRALCQAYGRVWAHEAVLPAHRKPARPSDLERYRLSPSHAALEAFAQAYCDQSRMHSPLLEWSLINALLRAQITALSATRVPLKRKLRAAGLELCVQGVLAGCAGVLAQSNRLVFWMVFIVLNLIRWISPTMSPGLTVKPHRSALLQDLKAAHEACARNDFSPHQLASVLPDLQNRGAAISPVLLRLLEKRIARQPQA